MRRYELSPEQYQEVVDASRSAAYLVVGGVGPTSPQHRANLLWRQFADEMGFDWATVQPPNPATDSPRCFYAEPVQSEPEPPPTSIATVSNQETLDDIDEMSSAEVGALSSNCRQVQMSCGCAFERRYFTDTAFTDALTNVCAFHKGFDQGFSQAKNTQPTKGQ